MVTGALARACIAPEGVVANTAVQTGVYLLALVDVVCTLRAREAGAGTVAGEGRGVNAAVQAIGADVSLARVVMPTAARDDVRARAQASVGAGAVVEARLTEAGVRYTFTLCTCRWEIRI